MLLNAFIFHYKSCFGIGEPEREKLRNSLTFRPGKYNLENIEILDLDEFSQLEQEEKDDFV